MEFDRYKSLAFQDSQYLAESQQFRKAYVQDIKENHYLVKRESYQGVTVKALLPIPQVLPF